MDGAGERVGSGHCQAGVSLGSLSPPAGQSRASSRSGASTAPREANDAAQPALKLSTLVRAAALDCFAKTIDSAFPATGHRVRCDECFPTYAGTSADAKSAHERGPVHRKWALSSGDGGERGIFKQAAELIYGPEVAARGGSSNPARDDMAAIVTITPVFSPGHLNRWTACLNWRRPSALPRAPQRSSAPRASLAPSSCADHEHIAAELTAHSHAESSFRDGRPPASERDVIKHYNVPLDVKTGPKTTSVTTETVQGRRHRAAAKNHTPRIEVTRRSLCSH